MDQASGSIPWMLPNVYAGADRAEHHLQGAPFLFILGVQEKGSSRAWSSPSGSAQAKMKNCCPQPFPESLQQGKDTPCMGRKELVGTR